MKKREKLWNRIVNYFYRTWKIKLIGIGMILLGGLSASIDNEGTIFLFTLIIALPALVLDDKG